MKKTLLLLPAAALLLVGCDKAENEEDSPVAPTTAQVSDAIVGSLASTYKKAVSGVSLNLELSNVNVHVENTYKKGNYSQKTEVDVKNFGFKLKIDARNLTKSINEWEAAIVVEDLGATVSVVMNDTRVYADNVSVSDIDLGLYLKNGNLYANLSDPELKSTAKNIIGMIFGTSTPEAQQYQAIVDQYAKDLYLENAIDFIADFFIPSQDSSGEIQIQPTPEPQKVIRANSGISNLVIIPPELPAELLLEMKQELPMILAQILGPTSPIKNAFTFTVGNNVFKKIEVSFNNAMLPAEIFEGNDVSFNATLTANFDNEGALASIVTNETFDVTVVDEYIYPVIEGTTPTPEDTEVETTKVSGSVGASVAVTYTTSAINMPDFSGYEPFVFPEL